MSRKFSNKVRRGARARAGGHCEATGSWYGLNKGERCNMPLDRGVEFDHLIADSIGGATILENCLCVCSRCHSFKSRYIDTPRAAKAKRQQDKDQGIFRSSRLMPCGRNSPWKKRIDGHVVERFDRGAGFQP